MSECTDYKPLWAIQPGDGLAAKTTIYAPEGGAVLFVGGAVYPVVRRQLVTDPPEIVVMSEGGSESIVRPESLLHFEHVPRATPAV